MSRLLEKAKTLEKFYSEREKEHSVKNLNVPKRRYNNLNSENRYPKRYRAEFISPGIVSYEDTGAGKVLVLEEALNRMQRSFIGKPVVNFIHKDLTPEEAYKLSNDDLESLADGVVSDVGVIEDGPRKGWHYADMIIWDEATKNNIDLYGFNVSCAYTPTKVDSTGGRHNSIDYDEEVIDGIYDHMAIVEYPRYEQAKIYENSKTPKEVKVGNFIMKIFEKKEPQQLQNSEDSKKDEGKEVELENTVYVNSEGEEIPLKEMAASYKANKKKNAVQKLNADDEVEIDGEKMKAKDLYDNYKKNKCSSKKKNAEPATDEDLHEVVDEQKQKQNAKEEKENFSKLENAINTEESIIPGVKTKSDRLERGKQKYSKTVEVKS